MSCFIIIIFYLSIFSERVVSGNLFDWKSIGKSARIWSRKSIQNHPNSTQKFGTQRFIPNKMITIDNIYDKIKSDSLPLFEFGRELSWLVDQNTHTPIEIINLIETYIDFLKEHYFEHFTDLLQKQPFKGIAIKRKILNEAEAAMKAAIPDNIRSIPVSQETAMKELSNDIDNYLARFNAIYTTVSL